MNKLTYTTILLLSSLAAFAQRGESYSQQQVRPERASRFSETLGAEQLNAPPDGGQFEPAVPIDNYQFLLLGLAVLLIAYFVWRSRQVQKA